MRMRTSCEPPSVRPLLPCSPFRYRNGHIPRRTPHSSEESTPEEIEPDEADERSGLLSPANSQPPA